MSENDQATGIQEPQNAAQQEIAQQPQYAAPQQTAQQPQYVAPQQTYQQPTYVQQQPNAAYPQTATDNSKLYSILSYLGILWLIGLLGSQKDNPSVRFHVNQGIILSIFSIAVSIVAYILMFIIGAIFTQSYFGFVTYISPTGIVLQRIISLIAWAVVLAGIVIGIVNASQGKEQPLPVIGKLFKIVK